MDLQVLDLACNDVEPSHPAVPQVKLGFDTALQPDVLMPWLHDIATLGHRSSVQRSGPVGSRAPLPWFEDPYLVLGTCSRTRRVLFLSYP